MSVEVAVNPTMLTWAVSRAGISMDDITRTFPKFPYWLSEEKKPTLRQLEDFSKKVHIPFGFLFLEYPPKEQISFPHFRTGKNIQDSISIDLYDTIQKVQQRQQWIVEYLQESGETEKLPFVGKYSQNANFLEIVQDIRATLGFKQNDWTKLFSKVEDAISFIIEKIENAGIFSVFNGCVENNTHRPLSVEECRGFVIVNNLAPFIFINNADGKSAQLFTIAHELAHIWLGISAGFANNNLLPTEDPLEILCDRIAAELLVPAKEFHQDWQLNSGAIEIIAKHFKVSAIVIARRAFDFKYLTREEFFTWYASYKKQFSIKNGSGGNFYNTSKRRIGLRFAKFVDRAVSERRLLYSDAYRLTGLRGDKYQNFVNQNIRML